MYYPSMLTLIFVSFIPVDSMVMLSTRLRKHLLPVLSGYKYNNNIFNTQFVEVGAGNQITLPTLAILTKPLQFQGRFSAICFSMMRGILSNCLPWKSEGQFSANRDLWIFKLPTLAFSWPLFTPFWKCL